jgi:ParB family transcriptional regulator, chromosome partitioning protein
MIEPRRGLGRGLSALLGEDGPAPSAQRMIPIERLHPGRFQPRRRFDEDALDALAQSIAAQGILQPILVRRHPGMPEDWEILAGERRWRAAQRARLHEVPVIVREAGDREALELALVENVQREDLGALEEAQAYERLMKEFAYSQDALAQRVGKSRSHVANTLRLLGLPDEVKALLNDGRLSAGHARALLAAEDPAELAREAVRYGMSVRQVENAAKARGIPRAMAERAAAPDPNVAALERELASALGLKAAIHPGKKGAGTLSLHYQSLDQLDGLLARLLESPRKQ